MIFKPNPGPTGPPGPGAAGPLGPGAAGPPDKITFSTGATRQAGVAGGNGRFLPRFDLISPIALKRLSETYGEGAIKYNDHNWRAGMPFSVTINHCLAHINEYLTGDKSEDHLAHAAWNLFALMHFEQTHPEMNDLKVDDYGN